MGGPPSCSRGASGATWVGPAQSPFLRCLGDSQGPRWGPHLAQGSSLLPASPSDLRAHPGCLSPPPLPADGWDARPRAHGTALAGDAGCWRGPTQVSLQGHTAWEEGTLK